MARPQSKNDLLQESQKNWDKLWELLEKIDSEGITTTLDFSDEPKRTKLIGQGIRMSRMFSFTFTNGIS